MSDSTFWYLPADPAEPVSLILCLSAVCPTSGQADKTPGCSLWWNVQTTQAPSVHRTWTLTAGPPSNHNKNPKPVSFPYSPKSFWGQFRKPSMPLQKSDYEWVMNEWIGNKPFHSSLVCMCVISLDIQTNFEWGSILSRWNDLTIKNQKIDLYGHL